MDYKRLALAAVVAWVVDAAFGFVVWGNLLQADMAQFPAVFRSEAEMPAMMPIMFAGSLLSMFALAWIYAKGYEGGSGIAEGARFGAVAGLLMVGFVGMGMYASTRIGGTFAMKASLATFIEMIVIGVTMGAVYKPAASPARRPASV